MDRLTDVNNLLRAVHAWMALTDRHAFTPATSPSSLDERYGPFGRERVDVRRQLRVSYARVFINGQVAVL